MLEEIIEYCRQRGIGEVWGEVLAENEPMLRLVRRLGFSVKTDAEDRSVMLVSKPPLGGEPAGARRDERRRSGEAEPV